MADVIELEGFQPVEFNNLMDYPIYENVPLTILHNYTEDLFFNVVPQVNKPLTISHQIPEGLMTRVNKVYTSYGFLPLFTREFDSDSDEVYYGREVREWDAILMSSTGMESPRRQPTELIYKGRKMKNDFYVPPQIVDIE